jgi:N-acetylmuramoyl-L-alanine amidase
MLARLRIFSCRRIVIAVGGIELLFPALYNERIGNGFGLFSGLVMACRWDTIERRLTTPCNESYGIRYRTNISTLRLVLLSCSGHLQMFEPLAGNEGALTPISMDIFGRISGRLMLAGLIVGVMASVPGWAQSPANAVAPVPSGTASQAPGMERLPGSGGRFVVVLDAAHGGDDGGAQLSGGTAEKTVTLALSVRLRSLLTARGFQVVTTREGNVNLDKDARAQIANHAVSSAGSAACLSFHASESGSGVHLFVSSLEPTVLRGTTRFLAWKTAQSAYVNRSVKLAGTVNSALEHGGGSGAAGADSEAGPISATLARASLPGVDSMACPAVAIEVAPIRGEDRKVVTEVIDPEYQTQIVEALAAALLEWKTDSESDAGAGRAHPGERTP